MLCWNIIFEWLLLSTTTIIFTRRGVMMSTLPWHISALVKTSFNRSRSVPIWQITANLTKVQVCKGETLIWHCQKISATVWILACRLFYWRKNSAIFWDALCQVDYVKQVCQICLKEFCPFQFRCLLLYLDTISRG